APQRPEHAGTPRTARGWSCCRRVGPNGSNRAVPAGRAQAYLRPEWGRGAAASSWRAFWQAWGLLFALCSYCGGGYFKSNDFMVIGNTVGGLMIAPLLTESNSFMCTPFNAVTVSA